MDLLSKEQMSAMPELRKRLRQLRWFQTTFRKHVNLLYDNYGVRYSIDEKKLAAAFFNWVEVVDDNKHFAKIDRKDFITFSAGIVLRELMKIGPATVVDRSKIASINAADLHSIVSFWPEGFLYTNYCICAIAAILEQERGVAPDIDQCADELRTWWSYKENVADTPSYAIAFLDKFLGGEPNWGYPDSVAVRAPMLQSRLHERRNFERF